MKQTPNYGFPLLENGDKYTKEYQNDTFTTIDREIKAVTDKVNMLDCVEGSILETTDRVDKLENKTIPDINKKIDDNRTADLEEKKVINASLETKANKTTVFTMDNMGQDIREAMTGGSVAVVGKNAILAENILDEQVIKSKTNFYKKTKNIKYKESEKNGYGILSTNGDEYINNDLIISNFIDITDVTNISLQKFDNELKLPIVSSDILSIAFYDSNKTFISYSDLTCGNILSVPTNTVYLKYQYHINYISNSYNLLSQSTLLNVYLEPYIFEEMEEINNNFDKIKTCEFINDKSITPIKTNFFNVEKNLFNKNDVIVGAILSDNGILATNFTDWRSSEFISVVEGEKLYFSNDKSLTIVHTGAFYDTNKVYISGLSNQSVASVPKNGYVRFSINGGFPTNFQCEYNDVTDYKEYGVVNEYIKSEYIKDISTSVKSYENKKCLIMGDSITALGLTDRGWLSYFNAICKPSIIVNTAVNGATWKDRSDTPSYDGNPVPETSLNVIGNQVQKVINQKASGNAEYNDFDIIIIACGTNDSYTSATDSITDVEKQFVSSYYPTFDVVPLSSVDRTTFAGAMRYAYEKLYELYSNAIFFITTPLQEVYENFESIKGKGELIDYIADRLSINTINTRRCGILNIYESRIEDINYDNPDDTESGSTRDLWDGIHTNKNGAKKMGEYIARDVIKHYILE